MPPDAMLEFLVDPKYHKVDIPLTKITVSNIDFDDGHYKVFSPSLKLIRTTGKLIWGCFMNNKKPRLRKRQIINSLPKKYRRSYADFVYMKIPFSRIVYCLRQIGLCESERKVTGNRGNKHA